jgi:hypothetical protein
MGFVQPRRGVWVDTRMNRAARKWAWSPSRRGLTTRSPTSGSRRSGAQVRRVGVVPVATLDVEVEVARSFERHVRRRRVRRGPVPVPAVGWIAYDVAGPDHVYAVFVGYGANAFDED